MTYEIMLPQFEENMDSAIIQKWHIAEGQIVYKGDPLLEVFTDEGNRDVIAPESGILRKQIGKIDEEYPVCTVIGYLEDIAEDDGSKEVNLNIGTKPQAALMEIEESLETADDLEDEEKKALKSDFGEAEVHISEIPQESDGSQREEKAEENLEHLLVTVMDNLEKTLEEIRKEGEQANVLGAIAEIRKELKLKKHPPVKYQPEGDPREGKVRATPAARRIAREHHVSLQEVKGTGPKGRIVESDVKKSLIKLPGKAYLASQEPVIIGSRLEMIPGNPENTFVAPEKLEIAPGKKLLKTMNQKQEKALNPELDFVPFVDENYVSVIPEEKVKISELDFLPFVDPPEVSSEPEEDVTTKISPLDFVPFVDFKAQPLREEIIVKPTPIRELDKNEEPIEAAEQEVNELETVTADTEIENVSEETEETEESIQLADCDEMELHTEVAEIWIEGDEEPVSEQADELTVTDPEVSEAKVQMNIQNQSTVITLTIEIDMSEVKELRKKISHKIEDEIKYRAAYTDFLLLATTRALMKHPEINSRLEEDKIITHPYVNLGLSVEGEAGFIIPVIRNAHEMTLVDMVKSRGNLLKNIKNSNYVQDDLQGSTFTITNLGMYGISQFTALIEKPNTAILTVGEVVQRMRIHQGKPVVRSVMKISLNLDQRVADSLTGAKFLQDLKADLENPPLLLF